MGGNAVPRGLHPKKAVALCGVLFQRRLKNAALHIAHHGAHLIVASILAEQVDGKANDIRLTVFVVVAGNKHCRRLRPQETAQNGSIAVFDLLQRVVWIAVGRRKSMAIAAVQPVEIIIQIDGHHAVLGAELLGQHICLPEVHLPHLGKIPRARQIVNQFLLIVNGDQRIFIVLDHEADLIL